MLPSNTNKNKKREQSVPVYEVTNVLTGKTAVSTTPTKVLKDSIPLWDNATLSPLSKRRSMSLLDMDSREMFQLIQTLLEWGRYSLLMRVRLAISQWLLVWMRILLGLSNETTSPDGLLSDLLREPLALSKDTHSSDVLADEEISNGLADEIINKEGR